MWRAITNLAWANDQAMDGHANVRLEWQAVNEQDETGRCDSWRVMAIATRPIVAFEQLVRQASSQEQSALYQSRHPAERGFLE